MNQLEIKNLSASYGDTKVIHHIDMTLSEGKITALLGRNGAGKSTLVKTIIGLLASQSGQIEFGGKSITGKKAAEIARLGIGYMPQEKGVFPNLTVAENLQIGNEESWKDGRVKRWMDPFPILKERLSQKAGTLSGGEQKIVSLTRLFMRTPSLLLLDEPTEGVQPSIVAAMGKLIENYCIEQGATALIVEQHLDFALQTATDFIVLEKGEIVHQGQISNDEATGEIQRYLGIRS
ncbi:MAG: ABC transporter ATP-binding protein [Chloroflexota bacterium]